MSAMESQIAPPPVLRMEFALTEDEFVRGNSIPLRGNRLRGMLIMYVVAAACAAIWWFGRHDEYFKLATAILFAVVGIAAPSTGRDTLRRFYRGHPAFAETNVITLAPDGVHAETPSTTGLTRWHGFTHFVEAPQFLLLYRGPQNATLIPKRAFESPEQLEQCRQILMHYIGRTAIENRPGFPVARPSVPVTPITPSES